MRETEQQTAYKYLKSGCTFELSFFTLLLKENQTSTRKRDSLKICENSFSSIASGEEHFFLH